MLDDRFSVADKAIDIREVLDSFMIAGCDRGEFIAGQLCAIEHP